MYGTRNLVRTVATTRLFGRDLELAQLRDWILGATTRMVTITGPVGVGKSAVLAASVEQVRHRFADGIHAVDVENLDVHDPLDAALAALLAEGDPLIAEHEPLVRRLRHRELLLTLDHCEDHVPRLASLLAWEVR